MADQNQTNFGRRQLLARGVKAAASIAAAGSIAYWLYDRNGPNGDVETRANLQQLPDLAVPRKNGQTLSIVQGSDRTKTVNKAIDLLGGIERFISPGDVVVIKPNVAFASPAFLGATAHPDVVAAVIRLCYDRGRAKKVIVTDNPINDPASCFAISGIGKAATLAGADVVMPKDNLFSNITLDGGVLIKDYPVFTAPLEDANKLIGIGPVKDHHRSAASMSMKNWYGLLGGRRNIFHQDINTIIAELSMLVKPTFVLLDGTTTMMTNGPTGGSVSDLKKTNTMIASADMVAADAFGCSLLNRKPADLPYLALAEKAGAGTADYESLKPLRAEVT
ncbi:MAG: DUF362 domain-containing protein [Sedimentisphaerales bacterium]|nr:DUF362 domain-containing protein [Sedimentisphaerales bacterium]